MKKFSLVDHLNLNLFRRNIIMGSRNYENVVPDYLEKCVDLFSDYPIECWISAPGPGQNKKVPENNDRKFFDGTNKNVGDIKICYQVKDDCGREMQSAPGLSGTQVIKRGAGRPERETAIKITEVPKNILLTEEHLRLLRKKRARDLNAEASKRFRNNAKKKQQRMERDCADLEEKNKVLRMKMVSIEREVTAWKSKCKSLEGPPDFTYHDNNVDNIENM